MSRFGKQGARCDWCGKITNNKMGEYVKPDGSCGYIRIPEWERENDQDHDICDECIKRVPHGAPPPGKANYWSEAAALGANDVSLVRCIHGEPLNVYCGKCEP